MIAHGMNGSVAVRQLPGKHPHVFVTAATPAAHGEMVGHLRAKCVALRPRFPGLVVEDLGAEARLLIPDDLRTSHESHFAAVMDEYVRYFHTPRAVPTWERPNLLARYFITTKAVELARQKQPGV